MPIGWSAITLDGIVIPAFARMTVGEARRFRPGRSSLGYAFLVIGSRIFYL
jgi:hypothetical protein